MSRAAFVSLDVCSGLVGGATPGCQAGLEGQTEKISFYLKKSSAIVIKCNYYDKHINM
jgi:hypothetical protein